ncbi:hypothetical protein GCM10026982_43280 [Nocardiopsis aegyptia]
MLQGARARSRRRVTRKVNVPVGTGYSTARGRCGASARQRSRVRYVTEGIPGGGLGGGGPHRKKRSEPVRWYAVRFERFGGVGVVPR